LVDVDLTFSTQLGNKDDWEEKADWRQNRTWLTRCGQRCWTWMLMMPSWSVATAYS